MQWTPQLNSDIRISLGITFHFLDQICPIKVSKIKTKQWISTLNSAYTRFLSWQSHYAFPQIFSVGGASWALDAGTEVANCNVKLTNKIKQYPNGHSFSTEMKIESKNCNIAIFIYSEIEKKKFNSNLSFFAFFIQIKGKWNVEFLYNSFYFQVC